MSSFTRRAFLQLSALVAAIWGGITAYGGSPTQVPALKAQEDFAEELLVLEKAAIEARNRVYTFENPENIQGAVTLDKAGNFFNDARALPFGQGLYDAIFAATLTHLDGTQFYSSISVPATVDVEGLKAIIDGRNTAGFMQTDLSQLPVFNLIGRFKEIVDKYSKSVPSDEEYNGIIAAFGQVIKDHDYIKAVYDSLPSVNLKGQIGTDQEVFIELRDKMKQLFLAEGDRNRYRSSIDSLVQHIANEWNSQITIAINGGTNYTQSLREWYTLFCSQKNYIITLLETKNFAEYDAAKNNFDQIYYGINSHMFNLFGENWEAFIGAKMLKNELDFNHPAGLSEEVFDVRSNGFYSHEEFIPVEQLADTSWATNETKGVYAVEEIYGRAILTPGPTWFINPLHQKMLESATQFYRRLADDTLNKETKRIEMDNLCMNLFADQYDPATASHVEIRPGNEFGLFGQYLGFSNSYMEALNKLKETPGPGMLDIQAKSFIGLRVSNAITAIETFKAKWEEYISQYSQQPFQLQDPGLTTSTLQSLYQDQGNYPIAISMPKGRLAKALFDSLYLITSGLKEGLSERVA